MEPKMPDPLPGSPVPNIRSGEFPEPAHVEKRPAPFLPVPELAIPSDSERTVEE